MEYLILFDNMETIDLGQVALVFNLNKFLVFDHFYFKNNKNYPNESPREETL